MYATAAFKIRLTPGLRSDGSDGSDGSNGSDGSDGFNNGLMPREIKHFSLFFLEARDTQGGPGGPRGKPGGPQGALGIPSLAFPWVPRPSLGASGLRKRKNWIYF